MIICMDTSSLTLIVKPYLTPATSAFVMGIVRSVFRQPISRFSISGKGGIETGGKRLSVWIHVNPLKVELLRWGCAEGYEKWVLPCIRLKTSQSNCLGVTA